MTECPSGHIVSLVSKESRNYQTLNIQNVKSKQSSPSSRNRRGKRGKGSNASPTTTLTPGPGPAKQRQQSQQNNVMTRDRKTVVNVELITTISPDDLSKSESTSSSNDCTDDIEQCKPTYATTTTACTGNNNQNTSSSLVDKAAVIDNNDGHNHVTRSPWVLIGWTFVGLLLVGLVTLGLLLLDSDQYYYQAMAKIFTDFIAHMDKHLPRSQLELYEIFEWTWSMICNYSQRCLQELQVHGLAGWSRIAIKTYSMWLSVTSLDVMNEVISLYNQWSVLLLSSATDICTQLHSACQSITTYVSTFISDHDCHDFGRAGLTYADVDIAMWVSSAQQAFITFSTFFNELSIHQHLPHQLHPYIATITSFYDYITTYIINHLIIPIDAANIINQSHHIVEHSAQFVLTAYDLALRQFHYNLTTVATNSTTSLLS